MFPFSFMHKHPGFIFNTKTNNAAQSSEVQMHMWNNHILSNKYLFDLFRNLLTQHRLSVLHLNRNLAGMALSTQQQVKLHTQLLLDKYAQ